MKIVLLFSIVFMAAAISSYAQPATASYINEIDSWQQQREAKLTSPDGWLNLAGLFWLEPGENSFGSSHQNKIIFPEGSIAGEAGVLIYDGHTVQLMVMQASITIGGQPVKSTVVYHPDSTTNPVMVSGNLYWTIIKRSGALAIRLRDRASNNAAKFDGIDRFATDSSWRVPAILRRPVLPAQVLITNVLGKTELEHSPGKIMFTLKGQQYALETLEEYGELFIIFADETSGRETYGGGRYLKAAMPGSDGITTIDFNKAYNPPCAFTAFATCPLPPAQNILPIAITAGEKNYSLH